MAGIRSMCWTIFLQILFIGLPNGILAKKKYKSKSNMYAKTYTGQLKSAIWTIFANMDVICSMLMLVLTLYIFIRRRFSKTWQPGKKS